MRSKRAAAAIAENKIRESIRGTTREEESTAKKHRRLNEIDDYSRNGDRSDRKPEPDLEGRKVGRRAHHLSPPSRSCDIDVASNLDGSVPTASGLSLQSLQFSESSSPFHLDSSVESSAAKARLEHQRRRSARQAHSNGPMILSSGTYYRMSLGSAPSPQYSPLTAARLSFTPVAKVPMTPLARSFV